MTPLNQVFSSCKKKKKKIYYFCKYIAYKRMFPSIRISALFPFDPGASLLLTNLWGSRFTCVGSHTSPNPHKTIHHDSLITIAVHHRLFPRPLLTSLFLHEVDCSGVLFVFARLRTALLASKPELTQHPSVFFYAPALSSLATLNL